MGDFCIDDMNIRVRGLVHELTLTYSDEVSAERDLVLLEVSPSNSALLDREDIELIIGWLQGILRGRDIQVA